MRSTGDTSRNTFMTPHGKRAAVERHWRMLRLARHLGLAALAFIGAALVWCS